MLSKLTDLQKSITDSMPSLDSARSTVQDWTTKAFVTAIEQISVESDRQAVLAWLGNARDIVSDEKLSQTDKLQTLYSSMSVMGIGEGLFNSILETVKSYANAPLPLPVKLAIPITLGAASIVGAKGAGIVALGTGIGVPILLLVFLGTAGITSVIETFIRIPESRGYIGTVGAIILHDELLRRANQRMNNTLSDNIVEPQRKTNASDESLLEALLAMDPFDFECHVMSLFRERGLMAWVTPKSGDAGVDGVARHSDGIIVVQCKRYSADNPVGRPAVQQFKGVVEEQDAWRGFIVTTSRFTQEAIESAKLNDKVHLVDSQVLLSWHKDGIHF